MSFIASLFSRSPTPQFEYTKVAILKREIIRITAEINALQRSMESVNSAIKDYENIPDRDRIQEYQNLKAKRNGYEERLQKANEEIYELQEQFDEAIRQQEKTKHEQKITEGKSWLEGRKNGSGWAGGKSKKRKNKKNTKTKTKKNKSRQRLKKRR
jgi:oligoendopeptidase F